jgi:acyl dehydratase
MANQLYYGDVQVDSEITTLIKHPTTRQMVKWAGATDEYYEIHYDKDFATSQGLPGVLVAAGMLWAFLSQMLANWAGEQGFVKKLSCNYRGMNFADEDVFCKGKVIKKNIQDNQHCLECEVWVENAQDEKTVIGTAIVVVPSQTI